MKRGRAKEAQLGAQLQARRGGRFLDSAYPPQASMHQLRGHRSHSVIIHIVAASKPDYFPYTFLKSYLFILFSHVCV